MGGHWPQGTSARALVLPLLTVLQLLLISISTRPAGCPIRRKGKGEGDGDGDVYGERRGATRDGTGRDGESETGLRADECGGTQRTSTEQHWMHRKRGDRGGGRDDEKRRGRQEPISSATGPNRNSEQSPSA